MKFSMAWAIVVVAMSATILGAVYITKSATPLWAFLLVPTITSAKSN